MRLQGGKHGGAPTASVDARYKGSTACPQPADAGNREGSTPVTLGSSGRLIRAFPERGEYKGEALAAYRDAWDAFNFDSEKELWEMAWNTEEDWSGEDQKVVVLPKKAQFVHFARKLPTGLVQGREVRSLTRLYAHTDVTKWEWANGATRVVVDWPENMPFQIMGGFGASDGPYMFPCREGEDVPEGRFPDDNDWPYTNAAVVLSPALFRVENSPVETLPPEEAYKQWATKLESDALLKRTEVWPLGVESCTLFSPNQRDLEAIHEAMSVIPEDSEHKVYQSNLEMRWKRDVGGDWYQVWALKVTRTSMYHDLKLSAVDIDMSGWVASGDWDPTQYKFQTCVVAADKRFPAPNPYAELRPTVLVDSHLLPSLYCLTLGGKLGWPNCGTNAAAVLNGSNVNDVLARGRPVGFSKDASPFTPVDVEYFIPLQLGETFPLTPVLHALRACLSYLRAFDSPSLTYHVDMAEKHEWAHAMLESILRIDSLVLDHEVTEMILVYLATLFVYGDTLRSSDVSYGVLPALKQFFPGQGRRLRDCLDRAVASEPWATMERHWRGSAEIGVGSVKEVFENKVRELIEANLGF